MARLVSLLRRPQPPAAARRGERGATLTEYGLIVALVVVAAMGGILQLQDESGSYLVDTGSDIGTPRELAADMSPDLPDEPDWLPQPPPPTTTTTAPPTTTTTVASSTTVAPTSTTTSTTADTTTTTTASTTSTTAAGYPVGAVIYEGRIESKRRPDECFVIEQPGVVGSSTDRTGCSGGASGNGQKQAAVGSATVVAIKWVSVSPGHCLAASGSAAVMAVCDNATTQLFNVTVDGNGWIRFQLQSDTNRCLAEHSDGFQLDPCAGNEDRQTFKFY